MAADAQPVIELDGEYRLLREGAGIVDRSRRAKLVVEGPDAAEYLQGQLTNDVEALAAGQGCYAALLDRKGHMQADMRVLRLDTESLWLDLEPAPAPAVERHLSLYRVGQEVEISDRGESETILSLIGPGSASVSGIEGLSGEHAHRELELAGSPCRAVATDVGIDLILARDAAGEVREALMEAGAAMVSEDAAEIVRVESGRPRFGREMTNATIPQEAAVEKRAVSFTKGCYIGQETVARLQHRGRPNRHLRGLRLDAPVADGESIALAEREVGVIGTAVISPSLGPIALAIVRREAEPGASVRVGAERVGAAVVELPF